MYLQNCLKVIFTIAPTTVGIITNPVTIINHTGEDTSSAVIAAVVDITEAACHKIEAVARAVVGKGDHT